MPPPEIVLQINPLSWFLAVVCSRVYPVAGYSFSQRHKHPPQKNILKLRRWIRSRPCGCLDRLFPKDMTQAPALFSKTFQLRIPAFMRPCGCLQWCLVKMWCRPSVLINLGKESKTPRQCGLNRLINLENNQPARIFSVTEKSCGFQ